MSALNVLCAQLTRDLFAIAKFLCNVVKFRVVVNLLRVIYSVITRVSLLYCALIL